MQELEQEQREAPVPSEQRDLRSTPLTPVEAFQADAQDDDPDEIFLNAVAEIDTQPLLPQQQEVSWPLVILTLVCLLSFAGGTVIGLITYPSVTIDVVPVTRSVSLTTPLALSTRTLAPVTLTTSLTVPTTGKRHQDARPATGTLTFYNGLFTVQTIPVGTVFTGRDGKQVVTEAAVTIPAANPPQFAQASVSVHALHRGTGGNMVAGDITTTVANGVLVKSSQMSGGQEARDFQAIAQADLDGITAQTHTTFAQKMPQAFALARGEAVMPTNCRFTTTPNHPVGAEASALTVTGIETCIGIAYDSQQLSQQAAALFTQQTTPGTNYQLIGEVQVRVIGVSPLTVSCRGLWAYTLSQDYEQFLAEKIAGDSPQQAQQYLLQTGFLTRATIHQQLPKDPEHIHFQVFIGI